MLGPLDRFADRHRDAAALFIRLAFGVHLMHASTGLFNPADQRDFAHYLASIHVPLPLLGAYLAHVTEFFGGLFLALGLLTRPVALALAFNFAVAAYAVHGEPYARQYQAWQLLAVSLFSLLHGAGSWSLDALLSRVRAGSRPQAA